MGKALCLAPSTASTRKYVGFTIIMKLKYTYTEMGYMYTQKKKIIQGVAGETAQEVKDLCFKHEDLSSDPSIDIKALSMACICNLGGGMGKQEADGPQELPEPHQ